MHQLSLNKEKNININSKEDLKELVSKLKDESGGRPIGIATHDPELRKRLNVEASAKRVANFLNVSQEELKTFGRITGHSNIHDICVDDLCTTNKKIS